MKNAYKLRRNRKQLRCALNANHKLSIEALEDRRLLTVEVEPNETPAQATFLPDNQVIEGQVLQAQDIDFFRVNLEHGDLFSINPANINDALFSPTLPPPIEIFDAAENLIAQSLDGRNVEFTVQQPGDYFIKMDSTNAYGTFTESYAMQTRVQSFSGTTEQEPNGTSGQANPLLSGATFRGVLGASDVDQFSFDLEAGDGVSVDFAGLTDSSPGARLRSAAGTIVASSLQGFGITHVVQAAGTYFLEVVDNVLGTASEYVGVFNKYAGATMNDAAIGGFADATDWQFTRDHSYAVGTLTSMTDVDVYKIAIDDFAIHDFNISPNGGDELSEQNRVLTLFNQYGQFLASSSTGRLDQENVDAARLGTYYLTVSASGPAGLGSYGLRAEEDAWFASQRDTPRHFIDFNQQMPRHQNFAWVNSFAVPEAIPFVVGMFDAKYQAFGVDATTTLPTDNNELVTQGYGDFGDIGAGGWGGGSRGQRSTRGSAVTSATQTTWNSLSYGSTNTLNHEFGHSAGLPHARLANAVMSYVGTDELLPIGQGFAFRGTDSRRPGSSVMNTRNFLDWSTQPGSQVPEIEPNGSGSPQDLGANFLEMSADLSRGDNVATSNDPNLLRVGDFDGDGDADVLIAAAGSNELQTFIGDGNGGFSVAGTRNVDNVGWWTEPVAVGDLNKDGRDDVVHVSNSQSRASILLSNASGALGAPTYTALPRSGRAVSVEDFDADGNLDLAVAHWPDQVSILLGNGNGTFGPAASFTVGRNPYSIAVGDFDGDNNLDFATADFDDDTISVLRGVGNGGFESRVVFAASDNPKGIVSGDFDGDGFDDLATVNRASQDVTLLFGSPSGVGSPANIPGHSEGETIEVGDVNRDGVADLLLGGFSTHFNVLLGHGDRTFSRPVSIVGGDSEVSGATADFNSDGHDDLVVASYFSDHFNLYMSQPDDLRNNIVTAYGAIAAADDVDAYRFQSAAGETWSIDVDAAEFQYSLDSVVRLYTAEGNLIDQNFAGLDLDSGLDSADPYLTVTLPTAGDYIVEVSGERGSVGDYRLKLTPSTAEDQTGPRVIAMFPDGGSQVETTEQVTFFFDDLLHPSSITGSALEVRGASTGIVSGTAYFNPLDSTLTWTTPSPLAPDTYTVTLAGQNGLTDLRGNALDGEVETFAFPKISGNAVPGGDFVATFSVTSTDATPANVTRLLYDRDPYQRGQFTLFFDDMLSSDSLTSSPVWLRGAGADGMFETADDTVQPLDVIYNKIAHFNRRSLELYTRGIPDPDLFRIDGELRDAAGNSVTLQEEITVGVSVPQSALFRDAAQTLTGLTGSYVNSSLRSYATHDDWRTSQTVSGTRTDYTVDFSSNSLGDRSTVGVTGGTDANWDNFSAQWDGWITIPVDGTRLQTRSDDGSRLWIDINGDGAFGGVGSSEFADNGWGTGHGVQAGALTDPLPAGTYRVRLQYEEGNGNNRMIFEWITPGMAGQVSGYGHGPAVVGMSITPGTVDDSRPSNFLEVQFSGSVDPTTLTAENFQVINSKNATFFDADDVVLVDADGAIAWDPVRRVAVWELDGPMPSGYYRIELNGDDGGITSSAGQLLDGEYLSNHIEGNTNYDRWNVSPSGDGIPGGDYVATFTVSASALSLSANPVAISEKGGSAQVTLHRVTPRGYDEPLVVLLSAEPAGRLSFPATVTFPAGQTSLTFAVNAIDNNTFDGTVEVVFNATADLFDSGELTLSILDHEQLIASINRSSIVENGGTATVTIVRPFSNGELSVAISSDLTSRLTVPASVTFADGARSVNFGVSAIDNDLVDGTELATISVHAVGTIGDDVLLSVTDHERLLLQIDEAEIREDGGVSTATVVRTDPRGDLSIALKSGDETEASLPTSIVIPDGQLVSAPFQISAVDDGVGDGTQVVTVTASADGYLSTADSISVLDAQQLTLLLDSSQIAENGGIITARISRLQPRQHVAVRFETDLSGQVLLPDSVEIAAGELVSSPFEIHAIDNGLLDGTRTVRITATADEYWPTTKPILVLDHEVLEFTADVQSVSENGGTVSMRVRRSDAVGNLVVQVRSSDTGELRVPTQVVIPDGSIESAVFTATAVDESFHDGAQTVSITGLANGYEAGSYDIVVLDEERLSASIDQEQISEAGGQATITLRRHNFDVNRSLTVGIHVFQGGVASVGKLDVPEQVEFRPGSSTANFVASAIDNATFDGDIELLITAQHPDYTLAEVPLTITDHETLQLDISSTELSELDGEAALTVSRPEGATGNLLVQLLSSDTTELLVPETIVIPDGQAQKTVTVQAVDDDLLDGSQTVNITASATGYESVSSQVVVEDYEVLVMQTNVNAVPENAESFIVSLSRPAGHQGGMVVDLASPSSRLNVPAQIVFPTGISEVNFEATPVDNSLLDGTETAEISATAVGLQGASVQVFIEDYEELSLQISEESISELDGTTTGQVSLNGTLVDRDVLVSISVGDATEVSTPTNILVPAGQTSATFAITAVDDRLLDGGQDVELRISADGFIGAQSTIAIADYETLALSVASTRFDEAVGAVEVTIERSNTDNAEELIVSLDTSDTPAIVAPETVRIPAGKSQVVFAIDVIDNFVVNEDVPVLIVASEPAYESARLELLVVNDDRYSWTNQRDRFDVNDDGFVTPLDALVIINELNGPGARQLPELTMATELYFDVNEDLFLTPSDALQVINLLNSESNGEAEAGVSTHLVALWNSEEELRRRQHLALVDLAFSLLDEE